MRFGTVALFGRTNVGKSSFLNAALGEPLAIVSPLPQTTRDALLGVVTSGDAQIAFLDTPGLHRPRSELGRRMNGAAVEAARRADVVLFMTDDGALQRAGKRESPDAVLQEDLELLAVVPTNRPTLLVINKVDRVRQKQDLLPLIAKLGAARTFAAVVPASMLDPADVHRVLAELTMLLPEGPAGYDDDTLTDRPLEYFVREYVREQVLRSAAGEVPHAVAVSLDTFEDQGDSLVVQATVHVEKVGQRKILVGAGGERVKEIGTAARHRIAALAGKPVHLKLFIRVTPRWKNMPRQLAELGYQAAPGADAGDPLATVGARTTRIR